MISTGILIMVFTLNYWPEVASRIQLSGQEDAIVLRNFYNAEALKMFSWTGVGIGNFTDKLREIIPTMDEYMYQPVHNIYLLIYTETGLFGLSSFLIFLIFIM